MIKDSVNNPFYFKSIFRLKKNINILIFNVYICLTKFWLIKIIFLSFVKLNRKYIFWYKYDKSFYTNVIDYYWNMLYPLHQDNWKILFTQIW